MSTPADEIALARLTDERPKERGRACEDLERKRAKVSREVFDALVALLSDPATYDVSTWDYAQGEGAVRYEVATLAANALVALGSLHVAWLDEAFARVPVPQRRRLVRAFPIPPFERLDAWMRDPEPVIRREAVAICAGWLAQGGDQLPLVDVLLRGAMDADESIVKAAVEGLEQARSRQRRETVERWMAHAGALRELEAPLVAALDGPTPRAGLAANRLGWCGGSVTAATALARAVGRAHMTIEVTRALARLGPLLPDDELDDLLLRVEARGDAELPGHLFRAIEAYGARAKRIAPWLMSRIARRVDGPSDNLDAAAICLGHLGEAAWEQREAILTLLASDDPERGRLGALVLRGISGHEHEITEWLRPNLRGRWGARMLASLRALTAQGDASAASLPEILAILRTPEASVPSEGASPSAYDPALRAACEWVAAAGPIARAALADVVPLLERQAVEWDAVRALRAHRPLTDELRETLRADHARLTERWVAKRLIERNRDLSNAIYELYGKG